MARTPEELKVTPEARAISLAQRILPLVQTGIFQLSQESDNEFRPYYHPIDVVSVEITYSDKRCTMLESHNLYITVIYGGTENMERSVQKGVLGVPLPLPTNLRLPAILVDESHAFLPDLLEDEKDDTEKFSQVSTPYGELPEYVVGKDGRLYSLGNTFLILPDGRIFKYETIQDWTDVLDLGDLEPERQELVKKLDFVPREEDSRVVGLSEADFQALESHVRQIEEGVWEPGG